jgi:hypothetical protein
MSAPNKSPWMETETPPGSAPEIAHPSPRIAPRITPVIAPETASKIAPAGAPRMTRFDACPPQTEPPAPPSTPPAVPTATGPWAEAGPPAGVHDRADRSDFQQGIRAGDVRDELLDDFRSEDPSWPRSAETQWPLQEEQPEPFVEPQDEPPPLHLMPGVKEPPKVRRDSAPAPPVDAGCPREMPITVDIDPEDLRHGVVLRIRIRTRAETGTAADGEGEATFRRRRAA